MELRRIPLVVLFLLSIGAVREPWAGRAPTPTPTPAASAVSITIVDPPDGASLRVNRIDVRGTFQGPPNTGITVNGRLAHASGRRFMLNALPLVAGSNTIDAVATTLAGESAAASAAVDSSGAAPDLVLAADVTSGPSPLLVTFTYDFRATQPVRTLAIDLDGDGRDDFSTNDPPRSVQSAYTHAGLYAATLTLTDRSGRVHKAAAAIEVTSADGRDSLFHSVWDGLTASLGRGDIAAALRSLNARARERYTPIFNDLRADLPAIVASYSAPQFVSQGPGLLEYAVARRIEGETKIFLVHLRRDADGVWRMDRF